MTSPRRYVKHSRLVLAGMAMLVIAGPVRADDLEAATAARMGDYKAAVSRWYAFAQQGDPDAAYHLGQSYERGQGVARDPRQAQYWYGIAAANGSAAGAYAMGMLAEQTERPDGTPQDLDAAVSWYRRALAAGDPRARERLAELGALDDEPKPRQSEQPAPATPAVVRPPPAPRPPPPPDPSESFERAVASWRRHGIEHMDAEAVAALQTAAKAGQPLAEYDLGYAYEHGLGVPSDPARAYGWYRRAEHSDGPQRLRDTAAANRRALGAHLSDQEKRAAELAPAQ